MSNSDLLVEIGTEELPPTALLNLSNAFYHEVEKKLKESELNCSDIELYATPRRLALKIIALDEKQPDRFVDRFGPAVKAAFDEQGKPSKAAEGFARSCGVEISQLEQKKSDGKADKLFFSQNKIGRVLKR